MEKRRLISGVSQGIQTLRRVISDQTREKQNPSFHQEKMGSGDEVFISSENKYGNHNRCDTQTAFFPEKYAAF